MLKMVQTIRSVRALQLLKAEREAAECQLVLNENAQRAARARQERDCAIETWVALLTAGSSFDPFLQRFWASEIDRHVRLSVEAEAAADLAREKRDTAHQCWSQALALSKIADRDVKHSKRRVATLHEERRLSQAADAAAARWHFS